MHSNLLMYFRINAKTGKLEAPSKDSQDNGGVVVAGRLEGEKIFWAMSRCEPRDHFNKVTGRNRAQGLTKSKEAIVTSNCDYEISKKIGCVLAHNGRLYPDMINLESYIEYFSEDLERTGEAAPIFINLDAMKT